MQSKPIWDYIFFGTSLRYLQDAKEGMPAHGAGYASDNIESFFDQLQDFGLPVTERAAYELAQFRDEIAKSDDDHTLSSDEARRLGDVMNDVRKTCEAEAKGKVAFIVTDKRIDVRKLLSDVRGLMAPDVFDSLPDIAQYDLMEAGKCIAFERPTAGAFHLLRATEAVLRHFYCSVVHRNRAELMWGPMVKSLRERRSPPASELLDNLDNIRRSFRNPTQHPDKIYDIQEVQDLFGLCTDVINRMARAPQWTAPVMSTYASASCDA